MNTAKLLSTAGATAIVCLAVAGAATYVQADPELDSNVIPARQLSRQQLWNFAMENAEGFNGGDASWAGAATSTVAKAR